MGEEGKGTTVSTDIDILILPYTSVVGQEQLKLALELAYIAPRIGGVLISGERGTGKSTTVRAFAQMLYGGLPVTIPINATEDRVVGGWKINELMSGNAEPQEGLLEAANGKLLYVDEVNLLDDHIVNIILDVTSTCVLVVQREGRDSPPKQVQFILVGTMNPEEGGLRPQLLNRFGLMVRVVTETDPEQRHKILKTVLKFDEALFQRREGKTEDTWLEDAFERGQQYKVKLEQARQNVKSISATMPESIAKRCVQAAKKFQAEGHRGDYLLALAACAYAARKGHKRVNLEHVRVVAPLVLQHRRPEAKQLNRLLWSEEDDRHLAELLDHV